MTDTKPSLHLSRTDTFDACKKKIEAYLDAVCDEINLNNEILMMDDGCSEEAIVSMAEANLRLKEEWRKQLLEGAADLIAGTIDPRASDYLH